jgi:hypothetical protein
MGPVTFDAVRLAFGGEIYDIPLGGEVETNEYDGGIYDEDYDDSDKKAVIANSFKFNPKQPRDNDGQWTDGDIGGDDDFYDDEDEDFYDDNEDDDSIKVSVSADFPAITEDDRIADGDIKWSEKQQQAAHAYTDANYEAINNFLRSDETAKISAQDRETVNVVRDMMRPAARNFTTFRRVGLDAFGDDVTHENIAQRLNNVEISDKGFMSTSISRREIEHYPGQVIVQFEVPKGAKVLYVGTMTANETNDQELVLDAGTRYRVKSVSKTDEYTTTVIAQVIT